MCLVQQRPGTAGNIFRRRQELQVAPNPNRENYT